MCFLYSLGETPVVLVNTLEKYKGSEKPDKKATFFHSSTSIINRITKTDEALCRQLKALSVLTLHSIFFKHYSRCPRYDEAYTDCKYTVDYGNIVSNFGVGRHVYS